MPASALALVLIAALLHAVWNLAAKKAGGDHRFALVSALMVSVLWLPVAAWFGWHELPRWGLAQWLLVLASAIVHLLYFTVLLKGYRVADLTVVYPVARGSGPLLSALGALLLLGEALSLAGVPPFPGFFAKLLVFRSVIASDHLVPAVVALGVSFLGLAYYIGIVMRLFRAEAEHEDASPAGAQSSAPRAAA